MSEEQIVGFVEVNRLTTRTIHRTAGLVVLSLPISMEEAYAAREKVAQQVSRFPSWIVTALSRSAARS